MVQYNNIVIITIDSLRWDVFKYNKCVNLNSFLSFYKAQSLGCFTLPSHIALFSGFLPHVEMDEPYYNRFNKYLFHIKSGNRKDIKSLFHFPFGTKNIITGFRELGYLSFGAAGTNWFRNSILNSHFDCFAFTGTQCSYQVELGISFLKLRHAKKLLFINFSETHEPFDPNLTNHAYRRIYPKLRSGSVNFDQQELFEMQSHCLSVIDESLGRLMEYITESSDGFVVVVCSDHGDCFGEDGLYGHGFWHQKIVDVPLAIRLVGFDAGG